MSDQTASMRDTVFLAIAGLLGVVLSVIPWIGVPIAAAGFAGLAYRGRTILAAFVACVGVVAAEFLGITNVAFTVPAVIALLVVIAMLPRGKSQSAAALLVVVLTAAGAGASILEAAVNKTTVMAESAKMAAETVSQTTAALGTMATPDVVTSLKAAGLFMQQTIWSAFFQSGLVSAVLAIAAIAWAAHRIGRDVDVPKLGEVDLTPHVLWPFVIGLLALAASYTTFAGSSLVGLIGLNLVVCARMLFFLQGLSTAAGLLDRRGVGRGGRIFALAAFAALDALYLVSLMGLLDFWVNFRRLPRDGATPPSPSAAMSD